MDKISASGKMTWVGLRVLWWAKDAPHWSAIDEKHVGGYFSDGYYAAPNATCYVRQTTIQGILEDFKHILDLPQPENREDQKDYEWTREYNLVYTGPVGVELPESIRSEDELKEFTFVLEKIKE